MNPVDPDRYKMGWLLVAFDLPVGTKKQRKDATDFREFLKDDGFLMIQWSVYARSCVSFARQETHLDRVKKNPSFLPYFEPSLAKVRAALARLSDEEDMRWIEGMLSRSFG